MGEDSLQVMLEDFWDDPEVLSILHEYQRLGVATADEVLVLRMYEDSDVGLTYQDVMARLGWADTIANRRRIMRTSDRLRELGLTVSRSQLFPDDRHAHN